MVGKVLLSEVQNVCLKCLGGWSGSFLSWDDQQAEVGAVDLRPPRVIRVVVPVGSPLNGPSCHESIRAGDAALRCPNVECGGIL